MELIASFQPLPFPLHPDFTSSFWQVSRPHNIAYTWQGAPAPASLKTTAYLVWTPEEIRFGYECGYTELDMDEQIDLTTERHALWDRDVCEAFIRSPLEPDIRMYKEFEVAPTGQWVDLSINRITLTHDWQWQSGMQTAAEIDPGQHIWRAAMAIPFSAFGVTPQAGEVWDANLFRVSRLKGERQFLAYAPTFTPTPSYHVPEKFVKLRFDR